MKMVADKRKHAAYHNKHWWQASLKCQHRWPWTLKIGALVIFWQFLAKASLAIKWMDIDQDYLQTELLWTLAWFMSISSDFLLRKLSYDMWFRMCFC